jgi:hypothetical protein
VHAAKGLSPFNATCNGARKLTEKQLNIARVWNICVSASTLSMANFQTTFKYLKFALETAIFVFILALKTHRIDIDVLLGVHHHKGLTFCTHVTRLSSKTKVQLKEKI